MKQLVTFATLLIFSISALAGGPWLYSKKAGFYQLQSTFVTAPYTSVLQGSASDRVHLNREVFTNDFGGYAEYGLSNRINLIGKLPIKYVSTGALNDSLYNPTLLEEGNLLGLSNIELGAKYGVINKGVKLALSVNTIWNTIRTDLDKGLVTGYNYNAVGLFAHVGGGLGERGYLYTDVGYVVTSNNFSDYFQEHVELGYRIGEALWLKMTLDVKRSMENGSYFNENLRQTGIHPNDQDWVGFGFGASYEFKNKVGINFTTGGAVRASSVGLSPPVTIGVYKKVG